MEVKASIFILLVAILRQTQAAASQLSRLDTRMVSDVNIECNSNNIMVTISTSNDFNGMIYPKGLSKNTSCMAEYNHVGAKVLYSLPLRACNTMSTDVDDGVEYFNTVVIQPHRKLVTNQGRGYHIRCKYQTKEKTITNGFNVSMIGTTPLTATAPMPSCTMKIFFGKPEEGVVAENVKIGDPLTLVISIDLQDIYGMMVTNCLVRDGLNWGEQPLINNEGCPVDEEIMGPFNYTQDKTAGVVIFQAHKFPYTSSVYYQCNVKLCLKQSGGCDDVPPQCDGGQNLNRRRRDTEYDENGNLRELTRVTLDEQSFSVEVYSGLYVNEVEDAQNEKDLPVTASPVIDEDEFCVSTRKFAIGIAIAGVLLMLAVMLLVACILHRRRRRKGASTSGSSVYSGPYSNHAYSRD